jgi:prepilin-type N-terminal cleavage/methylation domain-containing protein
MLRLRAELTRRLSRDDGFTLVELLVVLAMMSIVLPLIVSYLYTAQSTFEKDVSRSSSNDEVRLAIQTLDREVRSGNVVYDPQYESYAAGDVVAYDSIRVYTQSNYPTRGEARCVQWRITTGLVSGVAGGELQRRDWSPHWESSPATLVGRWRTVATGIRNYTDGVHAFSRPTPSLLNLKFVVNVDPTQKKGSAVTVQAALSGRNTEFFSNSPNCGPQTPQDGVAASDGTTVPAY